ncbi:sensor histidine kinase [Streptococcus uberis]|uniref:sensor histidine kinase n=1 Tax=Streptococcus uberis TaxID=1349 RepID=UPI0012B587FB|nr:sensor histidine kinase [Streptococcus uberis]MTB57685.1 sensor histidine kinase [Streptococcus uberis]
MIGQFFKEYQGWYFQFLILYLLNLLVFALYQLPLYYFLIASLTSLTFLLLYSIWKFWQFRKKMIFLQEYIYVNQLKALTSPTDLAYQNLLKKRLNLENQKLQLEKENRKKQDTFIKIWSHQMKLPLSALSLMSQTQEYNPLLVKTQVMRLENYLNRLLNYIKFSQHQDDFRFEKIDLRALFNAIIKQMSPVCIAKEISISISGDATMTSDKKWLSFALTQLLDNAIKYSHHGSHISIRLNKKSIEISDEGIGILEEDLPRLFDEGFTGFNGHELQKASGLGLYMTRTVLEQLHLAITIQSHIDQGTLVIIKEKE